MAGIIDDTDSGFDNIITICSGRPSYDNVVILNVTIIYVLIRFIFIFCFIPQGRNSAQ